MNMGMGMAQEESIKSIENEYTKLFYHTVTRGCRESCQFGAIFTFINGFHVQFDIWPYQVLQIKYLNQARKYIKSLIINWKIACMIE